MIDIHFWVPRTFPIEDWEQKIQTCLNDLSNTFNLLEIGTLRVHERTQNFSCELLRVQLDEALFVPIVQQLHIIILTYQDIIQLDHCRLIDQIVHIDSIARLTRRIQVLVFDIISSKAENTSAKEVKEGLQSITSVLNSKIFVGDIEAWLHTPNFSTCAGCDALIRISLIFVLLKFNSDQLTRN